jgi:flagellar biosynthesis anti-sigma factor FlgM
MEIKNSTQTTIVPRDPQLKKTVGSDAVPAVTSVAKQDNVAFSIQISNGAGQTRESLKTDEISYDKVAAIRDQLAAGTYSISGKDVAKKILGALK